MGINMSFDYYVDIRVIQSADTLDLALPVIRNQVYQVLHGAFRALKVANHTPYAIALVQSSKLQNQQTASEQKFGKVPRFDFDIFRVFSNDSMALERLIDAISPHWKIRDYSVVGTPTPVPTAKITGWQSYRRFRIPTTKMERSKLTHGKSPLHERRLTMAKDRPFLQVKSQSTGQAFTLVVDIVPLTDPPSPQEQQGLPDGYGLARASQPFALPVF